MALTPMHTLPGYIPMQMRTNGLNVEIDWCFAGQERLLGPFFDDSVHDFLTRPFNRLFRPCTDMAAVESLAQSGQCAAPAAFIFHLSRCGSTLLAQMFASDASNIVLSEAPLLDRILRAQIAPEIRQRWLQNMVLALARKRDNQAKRAIIKCDSWHTQHIPLIEHTFPGVPWIFLYRDPLEVLVSNLTLRAAQTMPGVAADNLPEGVSLIDALHMSDEHFLALKIAQIMQSALRHANRAGGLFINYRDLPHAALPRILQHFGLQPDAEARAAMLEVAAYNAKQPRETFQPDAARKQREASPIARHFCDAIIAPLYAQLESVAQSQNTGRAGLAP